MDRYDVAIIGLGPAGATLARLIDPRFRAIAIDRKSSQGGFQKPCGGLLSADAQKSLARFGQTLPKDVLVDPQIFSVKTLDLHSGLIRHYQRFYVNVDRHKFDLWLMGQIPPSVEVHEGAACTQIKPCAQGYEITYTKGGETRTILADHVVGADGANSRVSKLCGARSVRHALAIQQWFAEEHASPFYSCIFDRGTNDCCSWSISKDEFFIFGGAFEPRGARNRFEQQKDKLKVLGFKLGEPLKTEACMVLRPSRFSDFCCGRGTAYLVGEAAGFISASSLEGISWAIESGRILARVLNSGCTRPLSVYRRKTTLMRFRLYLKVLKSPFLYNQTLRWLVMKSGLQSLQMEAGNFSEYAEK